MICFTLRLIICGPTMYNINVWSTAAQPNFISEYLQEKWTLLLWDENKATSLSWNQVPSIVGYIPSFNTDIPEVRAASFPSPEVYTPATLPPSPPPNLSRDLTAYSTWMLPRQRKLTQNYTSADFQINTDNIITSFWPKCFFFLNKNIQDFVED